MSIRRKWEYPAKNHKQFPCVCGGTLRHVAWIPGGHGEGDGVISYCDNCGRLREDGYGPEPEIIAPRVLDRLDDVRLG